VRDRHTDKGREPRGGPSRAREEGEGDRETGTPPEIGEEAQGGGAEGATGAHGDNNEAHARRQDTIIITHAAGGDSSMGGEAAAVGVVSVNVGGAADVKGLDVNKSEGARTIKTTNDGIGAVTEASAGRRHEVLNRTPTTRTLAVHALHTKEGIKANEEGMNGRVVTRAGEADAVAAGREVTVKAADGTEVGRKVRGTHRTDGDVTITTDWREKKKVDGKGGGEGRRVLRKGEEGGTSTKGAHVGGDAAPEGEGPTMNTTIEEASTARGGGARRIVEGEEVM
jgi:hypothetical protein